MITDRQAIIFLFTLISASILTSIFLDWFNITNLFHKVCFILPFWLLWSDVFFIREIPFKIFNIKGGMNG